MGKCSDCSIFVNCPWFCNKWDAETEEPKEPCFSKEVIKREEKRE